MKISSPVNFGYSMSKVNTPKQIEFNFGNSQDEVHLTTRANSLYDLECEMVTNELAKCKDPKPKISSSVLSLKRLLQKNNEQAI